MTPERGIGSAARLNGGMELKKFFGAEQYADALESWSGVDVLDKRPVFASLFGDVFFSSEDGY